MYPDSPSSYVHTISAYSPPFDTGSRPISHQDRTLCIARCRSPSWRGSQKSRRERRSRCRAGWGRRLCWGKGWRLSWGCYCPHCWLRARRGGRRRIRCGSRWGACRGRRGGGGGSSMSTLCGGRCLSEWHLTGRSCGRPTARRDPADDGVNMWWSSRDFGSDQLQAWPGVATPRGPPPDSPSLA